MNLKIACLIVVLTFSCALTTFAQTVPISRTIPTEKIPYEVPKPQDLNDTTNKGISPTSPSLLAEQDKSKESKTTTSTSAEDASSQTADSSTATDEQPSDAKASKEESAQAESKESAKTAAPSGVAAAAAAGGTSTAQIPTLNSISVQVQPFTGSASLPIPINVLPGRAGIQPSVALVYSSGLPESFTGVGWNLDLGSIQRSTKKGPPKYDSTDTYVLMQNGSSSNLVYDSTAGYYRQEIEGAFAKIAKSGSYWIMTDKKGTKYFFGQTAASQQADPASATKIFEWALDRVEDISGNYMTITYTKPGNELLPDTIQYTGNTGQSIAPFAKVVFTYIDAGRAIQSYKPSFLVSSSKLLDAVSIYGSNTLMGKYQFTYQKSVSSQRWLLNKVQQYGAHGTGTFPPVTFGYQGAEKGFTDPPEGDWSVPSDASFVYQETTGGRWQDRGVRVADVNGDAYPDLVRHYEGCSSTLSQATYLNTKNRGFQLSSTWKFPAAIVGFIRNCPSVDHSNGVQIADIDGDMWTDVIRNYKRDPTYGNTFYIQTMLSNKNGTFSDTPAWLSPTNTAIIHQKGLSEGAEYNEYQGVIYADVNGDSYTDIVISKFDGTRNNNVYINQAVNGGTGWALDPTWTTPVSAYSDFAKGAVLSDLNGDGLADIIHLDGPTGKVYMNNGHGWVDGPTPWDISPLSTARLTNGDAQFADVNGDGLADVVVGDGTWMQVMINTGTGWFDDHASWTAPSGYFNRLDQRMMDANADGVVDYMYMISGYAAALYMNKSKPADLLVTINNGIGGTTQITYDSSAHYTNTFLPFIVQVVKSVEVSTGSESYTTDYRYTKGLWAQDGREFRGFGQVTVTDPDGNFVVTKYLQDKVYKGQVSSQDTYKEGTVFLSKTVNTWDSKTLMAGSVSVFPYLKRVDQYVYDEGVAVERVAQEFFYDEATQYGNLTKTVEYGEVNLSSGADIGSDKRTTETTYLNNASLWLLGLPKQVTIKDNGAAQVRLTSFYYDNNAGLSDVPTKGRLTKRVRWAGASAPAHPTDLYSYDATGNLLTTTDPKGNVTTITYDPLKLFPLTTKNALNQVVTTEYYGINSVAYDDGAGLQGPWGAVKSVTDANNQKAKRVYDALGRMVKSISPLDTVALPTTTISYAFTSAYFSVTTKQRPISNNSATIDSVQYYDGLGRLIQTKTETATAGQYIIGGQTQYNSRGLPQYKYVPRFTSNALNVMDPIVASEPRVKIEYDALGRAIKTTNPDGTFSDVAYNGWTTTQFDERGAKKEMTADAYGRVVSVKEYSGYDGRSSVYPAVTHALYATTSYSYDSEGNLKTVTDNSGNVTTINYDNLGRKTSMTDPDMGTWVYTYDLNGNLLTQKDMKNQTITFTYDGLNRLKTKVSGTTVNVAYTYDDTTTSGFAKGRLSKVTYTGGNTVFVYDLLGRETQSIKTIDGTAYSVSRVYDNLNNVTKITYPDASQVFYKYNAVGQLVAVSNDSTLLASLADQGQTPYSQLQTMLAKIRGKFSSVYADWFEPKILGVKTAEAAAPSTLFVSNITYNANGQALVITYGNGIVTTQDFPSPMFRLSRIYTTKGATLLQDLNYTYDPAGNILTINDAKNTADQTFTYDHLSRLKTAAAPATYGTQSYSYDEIGNIKTKESVTFTYSGVNAGPHAVTSLSDGTTIGYDLNGNMTSMVKTGANNVYTYDVENRLIDVKKNGTTVGQYFYDGDGGRTRKISYATGQTGNNTCFLAGTKILMADGTTKSIEEVKVGDIVSSYDEKKMGNVSAKVTEMFDGERAKDYLLINGHLKVTSNHQFYSKGKWIEIGKMNEGDLLLDQDGNEIPISKIEKVPTQNEIQVYNLEVEGEHNYYANGVLVHNKLSYNPPAVSGVPVTSGVMTNYVGSLAEETKGVWVNKVFLGSTQIATVSSNQVRFNFQDHLGGTNIVTNSAGTQIELAEYKPFGGFAKNVKSSGVENVAWEYFTGKTLDDETGLIFFGARYYSPLLGKFITPDTIVQEPGNPQTLNRYSYCNNNSVNLIDATGHWWFIVAAIIKFATVHPFIFSGIVSAISNVAFNASSIHGVGDVVKLASVGYVSGVAGAATGIPVAEKLGGKLFAQAIGAVIGGLVGTTTQNVANAAISGGSVGDAFSTSFRSAPLVAAQSAGTFFALKGIAKVGEAIGKAIDAQTKAGVNKTVGNSGQGNAQPAMNTAQSDAAIEGQVTKGKQVEINVTSANGADATDVPLTKSLSSNSFDPNGPKMQIGVDPKSITPTKIGPLDKSTLDFYKDSPKKFDVINVYSDGKIADGHHRHYMAIKEGRNVDVENIGSKYNP